MKNEETKNLDTNMEQLKEEAKKLYQLLEENEIGFGSWWMAVDERIKNINKFYYGFIPSSIKTVSCSHL